MIRVHAGQIDPTGSFQAQHLGTKKIELPNQVLEPQLIIVLHFALLWKGNAECAQVSLQACEWAAPLPVRSGGAGRKQGNIRRYDEKSRRPIA
jgi:hypothetical protein